MGERGAFQECDECPNKPDRRAADAEFKGKIQEQLTHIVEQQTEARDSREKIYRRLEKVEQQKVSKSDLTKGAAIVGTILGLVQLSIAVLIYLASRGG